MFIEIGVGDYKEANTRFLLENNNWRGLIIDADKRVLNVTKEEIYWKYDLTAVCAFITRENINHIIAEKGFKGEIGLLSIDIDGNDYWIWEAIDVVDPIIVIIEYNSVFGSEHAIVVPYDPNFNRTRAHYSNLYWGASIKALCLLAEKKGYVFVGSNSNGNNAYFIRRDKAKSLKILSPQEGYVKSKFRESRDEEGKLTYISGDERIKVIADMPVYDVEKDAIIPIKQVFKIG